MSSAQALPMSHEPASNVSTPGHDFPGAFPAREIDHGQTPAGTFNAAKQYIPAQKDVTAAFSNAAETAKNYLPRTIQSYFSGSEPQSDNALGSTAPDAIDTADLATPLSASEATPNSTDIASGPERKNSLPNEAESISNLSTLSTKAQDGSTTGDKTPTRDSLPTPGASVPQQVPESETPPARVENVLQEPVPHLSPRKHPMAEDGTQLPNGLPLAAPTPPLDSASSSSVVRPNDGQTDARVSSTLADIGHERATSSKNPSDSLPTLGNGSRFREQDVTLTQTTSSHTRSGSEGGSSVTSNGGTSHKRKFIDKIKGEAKVISGKLGRNEEKIEEGKRLMGKI